MSSVSGVSVNTSAKINEWGCRDGMHHAKHREILLAILSRIL